MSSGNESCLFENGSISLFPCLVHVWEEWAGLGQIEDYLNFLEYLVWVFTPLVVVFILPFLIVILLYLSILFLHVYKRKNQLREAYSNNLWDGARKTLATLWDGHGAIWHGYEIHGLDKIPDEGPALIVYYHGAIPVDYYYFLATVIIQKGRTCHSVADHFLFKVPGGFTCALSSEINPYMAYLKYSMSTKKYYSNALTEAQKSVLSIFNKITHTLMRLFVLLLCV
nr:transmembrane protein 68 isoform X1 [Danio rerio]|eukprot:XP_017207241.2 transmembrane protein 68 isoform X1 [Danio rerio]